MDNQRQDLISKLAELAELVEEEETGSEVALGAIQEGIGLFASAGRRHLNHRFPQDVEYIGKHYYQEKQYSRKEMGAVLKFAQCIPVVRSQLLSLGRALISVDEGHKPWIFYSRKQSVPGVKKFSSADREESAAARVYRELRERVGAGEISTKKLRGFAADCGTSDKSLRGWHILSNDHGMREDEIAEADVDYLLFNLEKILEDRQSLIDHGKTEQV